jgi:non-heme chloroperoxidase
MRVRSSPAGSILERSLGAGQAAALRHAGEIMVRSPDAASEPRPPRVWTVPSTDGVRLTIQEWSDAGPPLLLLHGFAQSHRVWGAQTGGLLTRDFRVLTLDLRGHGASETPLDASAYRESGRWADDLQAALRHLRMERPVLVGWSYAGRVINDYLQHNGDADLSGIQYVAATSTDRPGLLGPAMGHVAGMITSDASARRQHTELFVDACFAGPPPPAARAIMIESALRIPVEVLGHLSGRPACYDETLAKIGVPVQLVHGSRDEVVLPAMSDHTRSRVPHAAQIRHEEIGHAPFIEDAIRFNEDLAKFTLDAQR